jgi:hypothetical protein
MTNLERLQFQITELEKERDHWKEKANHSDKQLAELCEVTLKTALKDEGYGFLSSHKELTNYINNLKNDN